MAWFLAAAVVLLALGGCGSAPGRTSPSVVAGFYPLAEAATRVGGADTRVSNITPSGAEPHDLELTVRQAERVLDADLVILLGRGFQPAIEKLAARRDGPTLELLQRLPVERTNRDPHVWLDPELMRAIAREIAVALRRLEPRAADVIDANADRYDAELSALADRFRSGLASCERHEIVTSHDAFGYLARRFGLRQHAISGLSPESEPDPAKLAELADLVRRDGLTTIFTEELVSPRVAESLAREAGVRTAVLDPIEGIAHAGDDYVRVMERNLATLREALACR
jgi:zinc transport system substrate-binding protein